MLHLSYMQKQKDRGQTMMRNHVRILVFLILTGSQGSSFGYVIGGSNLGFLGYEEHSCSKPTPPYKPFSLDNQWEIIATWIYHFDKKPAKTRQADCEKKMKEVESIAEQME